MRGWFGALAVCSVVLAALVFAIPVSAAGDVSTGGICGNEMLVGFSSLLSECRGVEMVTPPYEAGEEPGIMAISSDGSRVINKSLGTYSRRRNGSSVATYLVSRGEAGWGSEALSPPSVEFPAQQYLMASSDLTRSLWRFRSISEPLTGEDLYLREPNGSLVKIGSLVPPADEYGPAAGDDTHFYGGTRIEYRDASDDLSHVAFVIIKSGPLWPFDTTIPASGAATSLYEYSGTAASHPALVGVSDGSTVLKGFRANPSEPGEPIPVTEVLPAGRLISDCETSLGAAEEEDGYNAMSANGGTVYFTAAGVESCGSELVRFALSDPVHPHAPAVNELYARVGGSETVPISEPTFDECEQCQTGMKTPVHEAVQERGAEFAGASEDGSKAVFMTTQELWPGASGMNLYEYNFDAPRGEHVLPISGSGGVGEGLVQGVARVSEDGSHVYFVAKAKLAENANQYGRVAIAGELNLYVFIQDAAHPTGEIMFITPLSSEDSNDWLGSDNYRQVQVTPGGGYCVFVSRLNVASGGEVVEGPPEVFEYAAGSGELVRVSTGGRGFAEGIENANLGAKETPIPAQNYTVSGSVLGPVAAATDLAVSADGSSVVFTSRGALTKIALEETGVPVLPFGGRNAYVFHSPGGVLSSGDVYLVSAGVASLEGLDASGDDVFFRTGVQLVPSDGDGAIDLYDARIDGGVPVGVTAASCRGEACFGPRPGLPGFFGVGSGSGAGGGNVVEPPAVTPPVPRGPMVKGRSRAVLLASALRACRRGQKRSRKACESRARKKYAAPKAAVRRDSIRGSGVFVTHKVAASMGMPI